MVYDFKWGEFPVHCDEKLFVNDFDVLMAHPYQGGRSFVCVCLCFHIPSVLVYPFSFELMKNFMFRIHLALQPEHSSILVICVRIYNHLVVF